MYALFIPWPPTNLYPCRRASSHRHDVTYIATDIHVEKKKSMFPTCTENISIIVPGVGVFYLYVLRYPGGSCKWEIHPWYTAHAVPHTALKHFFAFIWNTTVEVLPTKQIALVWENTRSVSSCNSMFTFTQEGSVFLVDACRASTCSMYVAWNRGSTRHVLV